MDEYFYCCVYDEDSMNVYENKIGMTFCIETVDCLSSIVLDKTNITALRDLLNQYIEQNPE